MNHTCASFHVSFRVESAWFCSQPEIKLMTLHTLAAAWRIPADADAILRAARKAWAARKASVAGSLHTVPGKA